MSSIEYLIDEKDRRPGGLNHYETMNSGSAVRSPWARRVVDFAARPGITRALHGGRLLAAASLLAPTSGRTRLLANAYLGGSMLALAPRHRYGTDGSDHAAFLVQATTTIARAGQGSEQLTDACLWFLASQSALSYGVSGVAKLLGPDWRNGTAVAGIMRTMSYGDRQAFALVTRYPKTSRLVAASVLALECFFPAALVGPGRKLAPAFVGAAATFHVANARFMGLNRFLPAFLALHPSVLYAAGPRRRPGADGGWEHRDDLMPTMIGATGVAVALWVASAVRRQRAMIVRGREDARNQTTSSGNRLRYRLVGEPANGTALVVCESGLSATGEHWEWVARRLGRRYGVLTYNRAGYGGSVYAGRTPYTLESAVDDLVELVIKQAGDQPVVLMGHSLGGYLVWRAAQRLGSRVAGVVVVDSSHPDEIDHPDETIDFAVLLDDLLRTTVRRARFGFGLLMESPSWAWSVPAEVRDLTQAQVRDVSTWTSARREWRAAREHFGRETLPDLPMPVMVVTADRTADERAAQLALHRQMAAASPAGETHVVPDCDHDTILLAPLPARTLADLVAGFVDRVSPATVRPRPADQLEEVQSDVRNTA